MPDEDDQEIIDLDTQNRLDEIASLGCAKSEVTDEDFDGVEATLKTMSAPATEFVCSAALTVTAATMADAEEALAGFKFSDTHSDDFAIDEEPASDDENDLDELAALERQLERQEAYASQTATPGGDASAVLALRSASTSSQPVRSKPSAVKAPEAMQTWKSKRKADQEKGAAARRKAKAEAGCKEYAARKAAEGKVVRAYTDRYHAPQQPHESADDYAKRIKRENNRYREGIDQAKPVHRRNIFLGMTDQEIKAHKARLRKESRDRAKIAKQNTHK